MDDDRMQEPDAAGDADAAPTKPLPDSSRNSAGSDAPTEPYDPSAPYDPLAPYQEPATAQTEPLFPYVPIAGSEADAAPAPAFAAPARSRRGVLPWILGALALILLVAILLIVQRLVPTVAPFPTNSPRPTVSETPTTPAEQPSEKPAAPSESPSPEPEPEPTLSIPPIPTPSPEPSDAPNPEPTPSP